MLCPLLTNEICPQTWLPHFQWLLFTTIPGNIAYLMSAFSNSINSAPLCMSDIFVSYIYTSKWCHQLLIVKDLQMLVYNASVDGHFCHFKKYKWDMYLTLGPSDPPTLEPGWFIRCQNRTELFSFCDLTCLGRAVCFIWKL